MAELTAIIAAADVTGRLSSQAYARLFAKNGGATADATFLALCIAEANSTARIITRAAFPDGLYQTTDTPDPGVVGAVCNICFEIAASWHPASNDLGGYFLAGKRGRDLLKLLSRDSDARPPGSSAGRSKPRGSVTNATDDAGNYTNPYGRAADRKDGSAF